MSWFRIRFYDTLVAIINLFSAGIWVDFRKPYAIFIFSLEIRLIPGMTMDRTGSLPGQMHHGTDQILSQTERILIFPTGSFENFRHQASSPEWISMN